MEKRTFLIVLLFFLLFFLGSIDSEVKGALIPVNGGGCVDRGAFCLESSDCCAGVCVDNSCLCLSNCCSLTSSLEGERGDNCYCERECRSALTCIMSIDGHKECCDDRTDWQRKAGVACYCHVECESGQCIGGVCAGEDTCSPAGCTCIDTIRNCERLISGEADPGLDCPDPSLSVCCCPLELPPPDGDGLCDSPCNPPCTCNYFNCPGDSVPIDCCGGSTEYVCCCPINGNGNGNGNGDGNGNGNGDSSWPIGGNGGIIDLQSPLGCTTIEECISRMINFLFSLAVILTPLMIILAGFLYITAVGRPEKIVQAQKLITWTLIGFLIVSLARAIIYVITSVIGG